MTTDVVCRLCGELPYIGTRGITLGHGDFMTECFIQCRSCHLEVFSNNRESIDEFKELALQRWERLML